MAIKYPDGCNTPRRKTEYLYKAQEELRILHSIFSKWLHEGLSKDEQGQISESIRVKYPYCEKLSKVDWDRFKDEEFTPKSNAICQEICVQRTDLKKSTEWLVDIGAI